MRILFLACIFQCTSVVSSKSRLGFRKIDLAPDSVIFDLPAVSFSTTGEQLKRKRTMDLVDESLLPKLESVQFSGVPCELTKANLSKNSRYTETYMDNLFPRRSNSLRLRMLSGKRNVTVHMSFPNSAMDTKENINNRSTRKRPLLVNHHLLNQTPSTKKRVVLDF